MKSPVLDLAGFSEDRLFEEIAYGTSVLAWIGTERGNAFLSSIEPPQERRVAAQEWILLEKSAFTVRREDKGCAQNRDTTPLVLPDEHR